MVNLPSTRTPEPFSGKMHCSWSAPRIYGVWGSFCHLSLLKFRRFLTGQHSSLSRLNLLQWSLLPVLQHLQTVWRALCPFRFRSLMKLLNSVFPKADPWEAPIVTGHCLDLVLSSSDSFQSTSFTYVSSLYFINFHHKNGVGNSVKSLLKSRQISTVHLLSIKLVRLSEKSTKLVKRVFVFTKAN